MSAALVFCAYGLLMVTCHWLGVLPGVLAERLSPFVEQEVMKNLGDGNVCLSVSGGGYRALITTIAFGDGLGMLHDTHPGTPFPFPKMSGTSGGAWGIFALCHRSGRAGPPRDLRASPDAVNGSVPVPTEHFIMEAGYHTSDGRFNTGADTLRVGMGDVWWNIEAVNEQRDAGFRRMWSKGVVSALVSVGVHEEAIQDAMDGAAFDEESCLNNLIITESGNDANIGHTDEHRRFGALSAHEECHDSHLSYCRSIPAQDRNGVDLFCDNPVFEEDAFVHCAGAWQARETLWDSLISTSSALTTGKYTDETRNAAGWFKKKAVEKLQVADIVEKHSEVFQCTAQNTTNKRIRLSDLGACDNNPWTDLLPYSDCKAIINLDVSSGEGALDASMARARAMGWTQLQFNLSDVGLDERPGLIPMSWQKADRVVPVISIDFSKLDVSVPKVDTNPRYAKAKAKYDATIEEWDRSGRHGAPPSVPLPAEFIFGEPHSTNLMDQTLVRSVPEGPRDKRKSIWLPTVNGVTKGQSFDKDQVLAFHAAVAGYFRSRTKTDYLVHILDQGLRMSTSMPAPEVKPPIPPVGAKVRALEKIKWDSAGRLLNATLTGSKYKVSVGWPGTVASYRDGWLSIDWQPVVGTSQRYSVRLSQVAQVT